MKTTLTNSALKTFKDCPKKYELRYVKGYESTRESDAFFFGRLMHAGIEAWSTCGTDSVKEIAAGSAILQMFEHEGKEDQFVLYKALALMEGYHNQYKDDPYECVAAEQPFTAPVIDPVTTRISRKFDSQGVLDAILKRKDTGRMIFRETKTTADAIDDPSDDYWSKLLMDSQVSTYYLGGQALGHDISSCLYDVIRKPTIKPKQVGKELDPENPKRIEEPSEYYGRLRKDIAERPGFYFARREVPRMEGELEAYLRDVWLIAKAIELYMKAGDFPRNTENCKFCPFLRACSGQASIDDPEIYRKIENVHRELTRAVA